MHHKPKLGGLGRSLLVKSETEKEAPMDLLKEAESGLSVPLVD